MFLSLSLINGMTLPLIIIAAGFFVIILYLTYKHSNLGDKKHLRVRESERQEEYECPRCGTFVDSEAPECPECGAEFEFDIFTCPVCATTVDKDEEECQECGEKFYVEERDYECPECGKPVDEYATECEACGAEFWSPVQKSSSDIGEEEDKKLDSEQIDIVED